MQNRGFGSAGAAGLRLFDRRAALQTTSLVGKEQATQTESTDATAALSLKRSRTKSQPRHLRTIRRGSRQNETCISDFDRQGATGAPKATQPPYTIAPPDILLINASNLVPLQDAATCLNSISLQQVRGEHLVRPDGTISLGTYGIVFVDGMTVHQAKAVIEKHLSQFFAAAEISLAITGYNSKVYYVITDLAGAEHRVIRLPFHGNETVLDAVAQIDGLVQASAGSDRMAVLRQLPVQAAVNIEQALSRFDPKWITSFTEAPKSIWVVRPARNPNEAERTLKVDWQGITQSGQAQTNYELMAGDRLYVMSALDALNPAQSEQQPKRDATASVGDLPPGRDLKTVRNLEKIQLGYWRDRSIGVQQKAIEIFKADPTEAIALLESFLTELRGTSFEPNDQAALIRPVEIRINQYKMALAQRVWEKQQQPAPGVPAQCEASTDHLRRRTTVVEYFCPQAQAQSGRGTPATLLARLL